MTVDWTRWMQLSSHEQDDLRRRYREIVKAESDDARLTNYARMNAAMKAAEARAA